jgi:hypothetical protein
MNDAAPLAPDSSLSWLKSLSFWLCLLVSATLFGAVSLAPRVRDTIRLDHAYRQNQWELVRTEDQIQQMQRIALALRNDAEFLQRLAEADLHAQQPDVQQIPVDHHLVLRPTPDSERVATPSASLPIYLPILDLLSDNRDVGNALLAISAALVIFAFTYFQEYTSDTEPERVQAALRSGG